MVLIQQFDLLIIFLNVDFWMLLLEISCNRSMLFWASWWVTVDEASNIPFVLLRLLSLLPHALFWYAHLQLSSLPTWNFLAWIGDHDLGFCPALIQSGRISLKIQCLLLNFESLKWLTMILCILNKLMFLCINLSRCDRSWFSPLMVSCCWL